MRHITRSGLAVLSTIGLLAVMSHATMAQSGTRNNPRSGSSDRSTPPAESSLRAQPQSHLALEGYCPVSLKAMTKWVKGDPSIRSVFDGQTYQFASQQGKQMFSAAPAKYVPALGGDCVVSLVKMGKRVPGSIRHAALRGGRLFLFANQEGQEMFLADPRAYENADLAYGGNCVVCSLNMRQTVPGRPDFEAIHEGLRYRFAMAGQRDEFLANPEKYEVAATPVSTSTRRSSSGQPVGSGSSSR
ncbi:MAG: hypothetical protein ACC628_25495 [Pirellulaceae bacterium]